MMIVMFLIALILGVIAYNYQGSLEKGKAFKTEIAIEKIQTILDLKAAEKPETLDSIPDKWRDYVKDSPLVKDPDSIIKDGWGGDYSVTVENGVIKVSSKNLDNYKAGNRK